MLMDLDIDNLEGDDETVKIDLKALREIFTEVQRLFNSSILATFDGDIFAFDLPIGTTTVSHNLKFIPTDIIITNGVSGVIFSNFTTTTIDITASSVVKLRVLIGSFK